MSILHYYETVIRGFKGFIRIMVYTDIVDTSLPIYYTYIESSDYFSTSTLFVILYTHNIYSVFLPTMFVEK